MCRLAGTELEPNERGAAWALIRAASTAGFVDTVRPTPEGRVTSGQRMAAAAVLRAAESFDDVTLLAVIDAAAHWIEEPEGEKYAYALLGAVTDGPTQLRVRRAAGHGRR